MWYIPGKNSDKPVIYYQGYTWYILAITLNDLVTILLQFSAFEMYLVQLSKKGYTRYGTSQIPRLYQM
jgi:hypothetical protein